MAARRGSSSEVNVRRVRPGATPEDREQELIAKAEALAERQLDDGTASAQVISHYLKLGSSRERLEQVRLEGEVELMKAKQEQLASQVSMTELYKEAIRAMGRYQGAEPTEIDDEPYD